MPISAVRCASTQLEFTIETYATARDLARVRASGAARCPSMFSAGSEVDGANWRAYRDLFGQSVAQEQRWNAVAPRIARVAGGSVITALCTS